MPATSSQALLRATRPRMPTAADEERAIHQFTRLQILMEQWDDVIGEWLEDQIGAERAQVWGIPDTSSNPLADLSRQLSTPGLYGRRPDARHTTKPFANGLVGERGFLTQAGFWTKQQFIQYLTLGLGDMFVMFDISREGKLFERIVFPHNVYLMPDPDDEGRAVQLWELKVRKLVPENTFVFTWDVYDLGALDQAGRRIREPSWSVRLATPGSVESGQFGGLGEDVSRRFLLRPDGGFGALVGSEYPWVSEVDGLPLLPFPHYQDSDTGQLWNWWNKRGAHRGTLNSALYWTYAGHCAKDATGSYVIIAGLHPGAHTVIQGGTGNRNPIDGVVPIKTKLMTPGAMEYHEIQDGKTPFVHEVGPGANLPNVLEFADRYEMKQAVRWGLNPTDLSRQAANPSSAAALMVSNEGKRDFSAVVEPVFRKVDLLSFQIAAIVLRAGGLANFPETGYSITYVRIPKSPGELKSEREDLEWEEERGQRSEIDTYRKRHEGTTEEDATAALVKVALDGARLNQAIDVALIEAGLPPRQQPPNPAADEVEDAVLVLPDRNDDGDDNSDGDGDADGNSSHEEEE